MAFPYLAAAQLGATALGSVLGRKKKAPSAPDYSGLINTLNQSGAAQRNMAASLRPKLQPLTDRFATDRNNLSKNLTTTLANTGNQFVQDTAKAGSELGEAEASAARRRILGAQPELNQNLRETLAASGLNRGGALLAGQNRINQTLGEQLGEVESNLALQGLRGKQDAIRQAYQGNTEAAFRATGLDADTMERVLASGREDLINELNALLQEEQNRTRAVTGLQGQGEDLKYSANIARNLQSQDLLNTLLGQGANVVGQFLEKRGK